MWRYKLAFYIQGILLVAVIVLGLMLSEQSNETLRLFHRTVGIVAAVVGVAALIISRKVSGLASKAVAGASLLAILIAGYAGTSLATTNDYDAMFGLMRGMGVVALLLVILSLVLFQVGKESNR